MKKKLLGLLFVTLFFALHLGLMLFSKFMSIALRSKEILLFITLFVRYLVLIYLCYKSYLIFCSWFTRLRFTVGFVFVLHSGWQALAYSTSLQWVVVYSLIRCSLFFFLSWIRNPGKSDCSMFFDQYVAELHWKDRSSTNCCKYKKVLDKC